MERGFYSSDLQRKGWIVAEEYTLFCSTIIPTIGRPTLTRAVNSVLNQEFAEDELEVIVVNDSGNPLPEADWQKSRCVRVINTNRHERSVARNTGAATAKGKYLHFLDDDDWLSPDAIQHLWELSQTSDAKWLYGISQLVDGENNPILRLQHKLNGNCFIQVMAGEWIPLQSSLIEGEAFFAVGGFNQLITGPEDIDLLRRIALIADIAETPHIIANIIRDEAGSTTDYLNHPQASRWAREDILNSPGNLTRMHDSASDNYWYGRILRAYLTSAIWNLNNGRLFTAISRMMYGIWTFILSSRYIFSSKYWYAVTKSYQSETFRRGKEAAHAL